AVEAVDTDFRQYRAKTDRTVMALLAKIAELSARIEEKGWKGIWQEGTRYPAGCEVSHREGLWVALSMTETEPGTSDDWRLAIRRPKARGRIKKVITDE